jgi:LemA protein
MTFLLILIGCALIIGIWFAAAYNGLVTTKALVDEGWSGIDVQLKRRYDLIPNLVATVKQYSFHEKSVLEDVTKFRAAAMGATGPLDKSTTEAGLSGALKTLFAVSERYPDLKANQNFLALQQELSALEHEIQLARRYYNGAARNYNIRVASFPSNIVASVAHFQKVAYFELASSEERKTPRVEF